MTYCLRKKIISKIIAGKRTKPPNIVIIALISKTRYLNRNKLEKNIKGKVKIA